MNESQETFRKHGSKRAGAWPIGQPDITGGTESRSPPFLCGFSAAANAAIFEAPPILFIKDAHRNGASFILTRLSSVFQN